jgi:lipopolysaccharide heptosyltransferase II
MKTLLRLPNWVGDTLLALPAIEGIVRASAGDVVLAGRRLPLELATQVAPNLPRLLLESSSGNRAGLLNDLRVLRGSAVRRGVLLTPSFSSALWLRLGGVPERCGWPEQGRGFLLTHRITRGARGSRHVSNEFTELARAVGASALPMIPHLPRHPEEGERAERFLRRQFPDSRDGGGAWVALCPGVQYGPAKQWPPEHFAELAAELARQGSGGIVIGAAADRARAAAVCRSTPTGAWANAAGEGSLLFSAELLRNAALAVCNDTGTMHLAAAVGTPVLALFGPTDPSWTAPLGAGHRILRKDSPCSPCFRKRCPYGNPSPCMREIGVAEVVAAVRDLLGLSVDRGAGRKALFLDRDGTLVELVPYLHEPHKVRLIPGVAGALRSAKEAGYLLVVTTNQSGIARGLFTRRDVDAVHQVIRQALATADAAIDAFYICPHHPDHTGPCGCRKPEPGMFLQAGRELGIDYSQSFVIGDTIEDLAAGAGIGAKPILVRTGYGAARLRDRSTDLPAGTEVADDLADAVGRIVLKPPGPSGAR